jgi:hypothetical protein
VSTKLPFSLPKMMPLLPDTEIRVESTGISVVLLACPEYLDEFTEPQAELDNTA